MEIPIELSALASQTLIFTASMAVHTAYGKEGELLDS